MGSYNFIRSDNPAYHLLHQRFDINPWILWGNSASDPTTFQERQAAYNDAVSPEGAVLFFQDALGLRPKQKGGGGDDRFLASAKAEIFAGKGGNDTVSYAASDTAVTVNLDKATPFAKIAGFDGYARGDKLLSIENLVGSEFGDILVGNKKSNILEGAGGNDQIFLLHKKEDTVLGGDGDDIITVKKGKQHSIDGGEGHDILDLRAFKSLDEFDFSKISNVEEIWVKDAIITPDSLDVEKFVVFGKKQHNLEVSIEVLSTDPKFLLGGADIEFKGKATISVTFSTSQMNEFVRAYWGGAISETILQDQPFRTGWYVHEGFGTGKVGGAFEFATDSLATGFSYSYSTGYYVPDVANLNYSLSQTAGVGILDVAGTLTGNGYRNLTFLSMEAVQGSGTPLASPYRPLQYPDGLPAVGNKVFAGQALSIGDNVEIELAIGDTIGEIIAVFG